MKAIIYKPKINQVKNKKLRRHVVNSYRIYYSKPAAMIFPNLHILSCEMTCLIQEPLPT